MPRELIGVLSIFKVEKSADLTQSRFEEASRTLSCDLRLSETQVKLITSFDNRVIKVLLILKVSTSVDNRVITLTVLFEIAV